MGVRTSALALIAMLGRYDKTTVVSSPPVDVYFALGTVFGGIDVSVMRWGNVSTVHFDSTCTAAYADNGIASPPVFQWPPRCAPPCFARGVAFEEDRGILRMTFSDASCPEEAARSRVGVWANETNQHLIRDTDVMIFETYAM